MNVRDVLLKIKRLAKDNNLSEPYIIGGLPRDKVLSKSYKIEDIDLTSGDESIHQLAELVAGTFRVIPARMPDGHYQLYIGGLKFDFSTNYNSPDVEFFLNEAGVSDPSEMQKELFSRDFTCNTLLIPLTLRKIVDPTGLGLDDIKRRVIRTPLPPRITLRDDTNRVVRSVYLAAKLDFVIEPDIVEWVRNHHDKIKEEVSGGFSRKKLAAAYRSDPDKTVRLITLLGLWDVVSIPRVIPKPY